MTKPFMGKGLAAIQDHINNTNEMFKLKNNESKEIRFVTPVDEIISVWEHTLQANGKWETFTCLGKDACPACQVGEKASFKAYVLLLDKSDNKVKYFKFGKKVAVQVIQLVEEYGDITKRDFKIHRAGEKFETTYQFFPRDPKALDIKIDSLPDLTELVAPLTPEAIKAKLSSAPISSEESEEEAPANKPNGFPF